MKIHKNDTVVIVRGKDRGKRGKVLEVNARSGRVIIEAANLIKKNVKPNPQIRQAGIVERPGFIAVENVTLVCPKCSKPAKVGYRVLEHDLTGEDRSRKVRICKSCQEQIE